MMRQKLAQNAIAQSFSKPSTQMAWRVGQNVAHAKFGEGVDREYRRQWYQRKGAY